MKLCNNPTNKYLRRVGALARFPKGPNRKKSKHKRSSSQRAAERKILEKLVSTMTVAQTTGIRTKKDRSHRATF